MAKLRNLTGLFLGAGASYEAGMPLTCDLTAELKQWLTSDKLRWLNESWRSQGGGHSDRIIDDFVSVLSRPDQNYESLLGYLETQFRRHSPVSEQYHQLYSWLVEKVYYILYLRHINNVDYIRRNLKYYSGLTVLANENRPLWVFSLNHDIVMECLATNMDLPLSSGFTQEIVCLPRRNQQGIIIGNLKAEVLPGDQLERSGMPFFRNGTRGINLLKIHGALDVFTFRDGKDLLKILPFGKGVDALVQALRSTNEELLYRPQLPVGATNEIIYADKMGEMQFLRRSLLAGAFKFDSRSTQVLPRPLLGHFQSYINFVQSLVCIGYGFGDNHINRVIREWLEFSHDRRLVIVDPIITSVPEPFLHLALQIELHNTSGTDYLDSCARITRSKREANEKRLAAWFRQNGETATVAFQAFCREYHIEKLMKWINTLPVCNGDIDLESLGSSIDQLIQDAKEQIPNVEEVLEGFLEAQNNTTR